MEGQEQAGGVREGGLGDVRHDEVVVAEAGAGGVPGWGVGGESVEAVDCAREGGALREGEGGPVIEAGWGGGLDVAGLFWLVELELGGWGVGWWWWLVEEEEELGTWGA